MAQRLSGFAESMSWVFLLIGEAQSTDMEADPRVVLDLALPQIGGRGGGAEPFALERAIVYHEKVLSKVADEFDRYVLSGKLRITEDEVRGHADGLVQARHDKYLQEVLPKYAKIHEHRPLTLGISTFLASSETRARAVELVHAVRDRIVNFAGGADDFCRYCGEAGVRTYCGVCKTAYFCQPCHQLGWKYHKRWCSSASNQA
ncbi:hypothetical protein C8Q78DRAFT_976821 [Trametes maxima]|nr:hypothetical protein C8Q78DRAFT_976821 [Trametes maxima]